jgi:hypothetical protein
VRVAKILAPFGQRPGLKRMVCMGSDGSEAVR